VLRPVYRRTPVRSTHSSVMSYFYNPPRHGIPARNMRDRACLHPDTPKIVDALRTLVVG